MRIDNEGSRYYMVFSGPESVAVINAHRHWTEDPDYDELTDPMPNMIADWDLNNTPVLVYGLLNPASTLQVVNHYLDHLSSGSVNVFNNDEEKIATIGILLLIQKDITDYIEEKVIPKETKKFRASLGKMLST